MLSGLIDYIWGPEINYHANGDQDKDFVHIDLNEPIEDDWVHIEEPEPPQTNEDDSASMTSDGSWIVTPPECFTRPLCEEPEQNELEDLLIEHPSMSVYHDVPSRQHHARPRVAARDLAIVQGGLDNRSEVTLGLAASCQVAHTRRRSTRSSKCKETRKALKRHNLTHVHWTKKSLHQRRYSQRGILCPRKH
ncbi:tumor protein p53-inducible nuclear protein 1-like isoform X2 [Corticium candelabrum]|uniref:tumor protein p53-inducible nuclear protein 1-like isoform X2 n=1 Tax=Corticium candelabrum TaxID=121492 RepID=UPI002E26A965|nr:tumor protein p53-inducible nuclear protein 1-like isoform X2 [Corticium candelabrum]